MHVTHFPYRRWTVGAILILMTVPTIVRAQQGKGVEVVPDEKASRVDVYVDGKPFTSYLYADTVSVLKKPVLYPLRTASGTLVTRGFPLDPRPGERVDHPHHIGLWFNYGNVNGLDFWNNSDAIPAEQASKMGTIRHREIKAMKSGEHEGVLEVTSDWLAPDNTVLLKEDTRFVFHAEPNTRIIDRITTLTAQDERVSLADNKEGVLGIRVTRALEQPSDKAEVFTDASGKATDVPVLNNEGVTGMYHSSEGLTGDDVWGTRAAWTRLSGTVDGEPVTLAIFDHPDNVGYPTYWHARGYGLFAANPLGQKDLSGGAEELNFALEPGESTTFRHRIVILSGEEVTDEMMNERYKAFTDEMP